MATLVASLPGPMLHIATTDCRIGTQLGDALARRVLELKQLRSLSLRSAGLGPPFAAALAAALAPRTGPTLSVSLRQNQLPQPTPFGHN